MHIYVEIYGHRIPTYGLLITIRCDFGEFNSHYMYETKI